MAASSENKDKAVHHFSECPLCSHKYGNARMVMVQQDDDRTGFHITCPKCRVSVLVFLANGQMGTISVGMVTDLDRSEVRGLLRGDVISPNDVLRQYEKLQSPKVTMDDLLEVAPRKETVKKIIRKVK